MKHLTSKFIVVVASAIGIVGCGKSIGPTAPTGAFGDNRADSVYELRGDVQEQGPDGAEPAEGVSAMVSNGSLQTVAVTDAQGAFRLEGVPAGQWTILLSKAGYLDRTMEVTVSSSDAYVSCLLEREPVATEQGRRARIRR